MLPWMASDRLWLVCKEDSPRLRYLIELWNSQVLSPLLVYSSVPREGAYIDYNGEGMVPNSGFLFSKSLQPEWGIASDYRITHGKLNFDFFSIAFALATESYAYAGMRVDKYGRYEEREHPVIVQGLHKYPFFARWASELCKLLGMTVQWYPHEPLWLSIDIDNPFYFGKRGFLRQLKSLMGSVIRSNYHELKHKLRIGLGRSHDPFSTKQWLNLLKNYPYFLVFFLMQNGKNHSNTSPKNVIYHTEIKELDVHRVGIHPSFEASVNAKVLLKEKNLLEQVHQMPISKARTHFLRYQLPNTFENFMSIGINQDFTTCFYSVAGLKHGMVRPFRWYNVSQEQTTNLLRFPVYMMDRHIFREVIASDFIQEQTKIIQDYGGLPMILLHNETFSGIGEWQNFVERYLGFLSLNQ